jgi:hypothetical protein
VRVATILLSQNCRTSKLRALHECCSFTIVIRHYFLPAVDLIPFFDVVVVAVFFGLIFGTS